MDFKKKQTLIYKRLHYISLEPNAFDFCLFGFFSITFCIPLYVPPMMTCHFFFFFKIWLFYNLFWFDNKRAIIKSGCHRLKLSLNFFIFTRVEF